MGRLVYAAATEYDIEDRLLAHLQIVAVAKLRRQEAFLLSWDVERGHGSGHVSLWMSPAMPLQFLFAGSREPQISTARLEQMMEMASSARGLVLLPEGRTAMAR